MRRWTVLDMKIHVKDKVSYFLCINFSYFDNKFLPKDIILIRKNEKCHKLLEERHRGVEATTKGRPRQVGGSYYIKFKFTLEYRRFP
jgi:hypothetical protein